MRAALLALALSVSACNASPAQVDATIQAGANLAACILSEILGGITNPAQLLACAGATESLIVQVIDDFTAQRVSDAGLAAVVPTLTTQQVEWLKEAKANAVAALAKKATAK